LIDLGVESLDYSKLWLVVGFLGSLVLFGNVQYLGIAGHEFVEDVLEIALPSLLSLTIESSTLLPKSLSLKCPALKELIIRGKPEETLRSLSSLDLSSCCKLKEIDVQKCVIDKECLTVEWVSNLLSVSPYITRESSSRLVDLLALQDQHVCWNKLHLF